MADLDFSTIPLRSRQAAMPFAMNPSSDVNDGTPGLYTFRSGASSMVDDAISDHLSRRILGIYPDSYERAIDEDISMKHLFAIDYATGEHQKTITFDTILQNVPAITIREYLPQSRLDSTISYFTNLYRLVTKIFRDEKNSKDKPKGGVSINFSKEDIKKLFSSIGQMAKWSFEYLTGMTDNKEAIWDAIDKSEAAKTANANDLAKDDEQLKNAIYNFPFTMYYFIQTSLTTNIYEFPAIIPDGRMYSSTGHEGWNTGANELSITGILSKTPLIGSILKNVLNNISINFMPWWDGDSGHKTAEPEITVKFHLFNDNIVKAITNFLCVNTFIANNKWFQYNMLQQAPSLYEIKIDGCNRLFACTCNATVRSVGCLRTPPKKFYEGLDMNLQGVSGDFLDNLIKNRTVKIPDVYEVELVFKSILPANFNNFMYQYSAAAMNFSQSKYDEKVSNSLQKMMDDFKEKAKSKFQEFYNGGDSNKPAESPKPKTEEKPDTSPANSPAVT